MELWKADAGATRSVMPIGLSIKPLVAALNLAKINAADREYFEQQIRPLLTLPGIELIGEIADGDK